MGGVGSLFGPYGLYRYVDMDVCIGLFHLPKSEAYLTLEQLQELQFKWGLSAGAYGLACLALLFMTIYLFRRFRKKEAACIRND